MAARYVTWHQHSKQQPAAAEDMSNVVQMAAVAEFPVLLQIEGAMQLLT